MDLLTLLLGGFVVLYIGAYILKSFMFYRKCVIHEEAGNYIECEGYVSELLEEKKKAIQGALVFQSYPCYRAAYGGSELVYTSVIKRFNITVGDSVVLLYNEGSGVLWAKGDMPLLKKQILLRIFILCALVTALLLSRVLR